MQVRKGTEAIETVRNIVRDDGVAGSNPATPTSLRTETCTDTPKVSALFTWQCLLVGHRGHCDHERDEYGVWWIGLRCDRCGKLTSTELSVYQDESVLPTLGAST